MWDVILRGFLGSGIASLGFAVLFNIRGRAVLYASLAGGIGGLVYNLCFYGAQVSAVAASFAGAIMLTVCCEAFARYLKKPVTTFLACALIPLVPGGDAYRMMISFMNGLLYPGLGYALETMSIAGMMALGILIVSALTRFFFYSKRKVTQIHISSHERRTNRKKQR